MVSLLTSAVKYGVNCGQQASPTNPTMNPSPSKLVRTLFGNEVHCLQAVAHSLCDLLPRSENQLVCFHGIAHDFVEMGGIPPLLENSRKGAKIPARRHASEHAIEDALENAGFFLPFRIEELSCPLDLEKFSRPVERRRFFE
jgi:hypothetical protein